LSGDHHQRGTVRQRGEVLPGENHQDIDHRAEEIILQRGIILLIGTTLLSEESK